MKCPNCGNENPPDYVFCDECGARLLGDEAGVASQPGDASGHDAVVAGAAPAVFPAHQSGEPAEDTGYTGYAATGAPSYSGAGPEAPTAGYSAEGGQGYGASDNMQESFTGGTGAGAGTSDVATGGIGNGTATPGSFEQPAIAHGGGHIEVPVTEDTVQSYDTGADGQPPEEIGRPSAASQTSDGAADALPGVTPLDTFEQGHSAEATSMVYTPDDSADGGAGAVAASDQGVSAGEALRYLDEAQRALGSGDWAGFGRGMAELRAYLTGTGGASLGTGIGVADYSATPTSRPPTSAGSRQDSATYPAESATQDADYSTPGTSVSQQHEQQAGSPTLEPEAEAGTLPADAAIEATRGSGVDTGYGVANQHDVMDGETTGAVASSAVGSGVAISNNGAADNTIARLVVISTGAELPLPDQEEITVGREDPSSGIFPDVDLTPYGGEEGGVSRRHARMLYVNGEYFVEDLQSTNFTKLDGQRLPAHVRERLEDGARIDFGRVATIFRRS